MLTKRLANELAAQIDTPDQLAHLLRRIAQRTARLAHHAHVNAYTADEDALNAVYELLCSALVPINSYPHIHRR